MKPRLKIGIIFFSLVIGLLLVDMLSKLLTDDMGYTVIIKGVLSFWSYHNTGISFGLFVNAGIWLIVLISALTVATIAAWYFIIFRKSTVGAKYEMHFGNVAFAFFATGAIGNLYDRIAYGHVRDFIKLDFLGSFPIFNFADTCLTIGTIMLAVYLIFFSDTSNKKEKSTKLTSETSNQNKGEINEA